MSEPLHHLTACPVRERADRILLLSFGELAQRWLDRRAAAPPRRDPRAQKTFVQCSKKSLQDGFQRV